MVDVTPPMPARRLFVYVFISISLPGRSSRVVSCSGAVRGGGFGSIGGFRRSAVVVAPSGEVQRDVTLESLSPCPVGRCFGFWLGLGWTRWAPRGGGEERSGWPHGPHPDTNVLGGLSEEGGRGKKYV